MVEEARHLPVRVPSEVRELDGFPFTVRQRRDRFAYLLGDGEIPRFEVDVVVRDHRGACGALLPLPPAGVGTQPVDTTRVRVHEHERAQGAAAAVEAVGMLPEAQEHLLHHLLRDRSVPQHALREAEDRARVAPVGLGEGVGLVPGDGDDEADVFGVRVRRHFGHTGSSPPTAVRDDGSLASEPRCATGAGAPDASSYPRGMQGDADGTSPAAPRESVRPEIVGPGTGAPPPVADGQAEDEQSEQVTSPTKLIRIASMVRTMLDEVRRAPLDDAGRRRLREIHEKSLDELESVLSPDLQQELSEVVLPITGDTPSESELRLAQAQLVGWLEGLFHGIQATLFTQQAMAQSQLDEMRRRRALEPGMMGREQQPSPSGYL